MAFDDSNSNDLIDLLSDDDGGETASSSNKPNNEEGKRKATGKYSKPNKSHNSNAKHHQPNNTRPQLQAGLVLEEDLNDYSQSALGETTTVESYVQEQLDRIQKGQQPRLYHDPDFEAVPSSIDGANKKDIPKCRCSPAQISKLSRT
jgi:hypothetical protein